MIEALRAVFDSDPRLAYGLLFGSHARGTAGIESDLDIAVAIVGADRFDVLALGELTSRLEAAVGKDVHLVLIDEAPPGLAYRIFRDGQLIAVRDRAMLIRRRARAILEYLDFQPVEELCARGVLTRHGR
jgi:uncharacterized protein